MPELIATHGQEIQCALNLGPEICMRGTGWQISEEGVAVGLEGRLTKENMGIYA